MISKIKVTIISLLNIAIWIAQVMLGVSDCVGNTINKIIATIEKIQVYLGAKKSG